MKRLDGWLIDWVDGRYYGSRYRWSGGMWAWIALRLVDRYWRRYGEGPMVSNN